MLILKAKKRKDKGKKANLKLRKKNIIPAVIYGRKQKNILIKLDYKEIIKKKENELSNPLKLNIKNYKTIKVIIKEIQFHPFKSKIIHLDFLQI